MENFTLAQDNRGNILLEDGKGRCPFDPNFKSTALVVGEWGAGQAGGPGSLVPCWFPGVQQPQAAFSLALLSSYSLLCSPQARRAALRSLWALSGKGPLGMEGKTMTDSQLTPPRWTSQGRGPGGEEHP